MTGRAHDPYAALRVPDFRRLIGTQFLSSMANQLLAVALGWHIYERTGSALALGYVGLANLAPVLVLFLPAGQFVDRFDRRRLIVTSLLLSSFASVALALAGRWDAPIAWLYAGCALNSAAMTLNRPARSALISGVVPAPVLSSAMAWSSSTFQVAAVAGPALAGGLIAWTSNAVTVYEVNVALTVVATLLAFRLAPPKPLGAPAGRTWRDLFAGLTHVWQTRVILGAISLDLLAVLFGGATALLPIYAKDILAVGPVGLGWLTAAPAVGAFAMGLVLGHRPPLERAGAAIFLAIAVFGAATIVFGLSTSFLLSLAMLALLGAADNVSIVVRNTLVQTHTPDALRGRVSSVNQVFVSSSNELGALESGVVASLTNPVFAVWSGGVATVLLVIGAVRAFPELRRLRRL